MKEETGSYKGLVMSKTNIFEKFKQHLQHLWGFSHEKEKEQWLTESSQASYCAPWGRSQTWVMKTAEDTKQNRSEFCDPCLLPVRHLLST